ncbi:MAG: serine/threonine protein kinase [Saprospiraceae bacterium]|nr:serine/threonine protein kinase [Saprospiraceae bacterium]
MIQSINNIRALSTEFYQDFKKINSIEIDDNKIGSGAFGAVYKCLSINGGQRPAMDQVIKIFAEGTGNEKGGLETIQALQKKLKEEDAKLRKSKNIALLDHYPALLGCPQFSFEGIYKGNKVMGYSANNLTSLGFEEFKLAIDPEAENNGVPTDLSDRYDQAPMIARKQIAWHLAAAFDVLRACFYIHADFKAEALFVDIKKFRCAIIDYDSGAVIQDDDSNVPSTIGTPQDWLAPEINKQLDLVQQGEQNLINVNLPSDLWSLSIAIHYILFKFHPLFFLSVLSDDSVRKYLNKFKFPHVDCAFEFYKTNEADLEILHDWYVNYFENNLEAPLAGKIKSTVTDGYFNPALRVSANQWKTLLQVTQLPPEIKMFQSSTARVMTLAPVRFDWQVENAFSVSIDGQDVTNQSFSEIVIRRDKDVELVAYSPFGVVRKTIRIEVSKDKPQIRFFNSDKPVRNDQQPCLLTWSVAGAETVSIDQGIGDVTGLTDCDASPTSDTVYTLTATSWFGVSATAHVKISLLKIPPKILRFKSDKFFLRKKETIRLSWQIENAARIVIDNNIGDVTNQSYCDAVPEQDTIYQLTATNFFGLSERASFIVQVSRIPPRIAFFQSNRFIVMDDKGAVLSWDIKDAEKVYFDNNQEINPSGSLEVHPEQDTVYTLKAVGCFGMVSEARVRVSVMRQPPFIRFFTASPMMLYVGEETEIKWQVTQSETVTLNHGIGNVVHEGRLKSSPLRDTTYVLTARNKYGMETRAQFTIRVLQKPVLRNFRVQLLKPPTLKT